MSLVALHDLLLYCGPFPSKSYAHVERLHLKLSVQTHALRAGNAHTDFRFVCYFNKKSSIQTCNLCHIFNETIAFRREKQVLWIVGQSVVEFVLYMHQRALHYLLCSSLSVFAMNMLTIHVHVYERYEAVKGKGRVERAQYSRII